MNTKQEGKFQIGQVVATPGALEALARNNANGLGYHRQHASGDWGVLSIEDKQANEEALENGARILSAYILKDETKLWVITEATVDDQGARAFTCVLLPEEY